MERRNPSSLSNQNPSSENYYPTDRNTPPALDQTLESSFSRLTLSSFTPPFHPDDLDYLIGAEGYSTQGLRAQNAVDGQMGFGFGGSGWNPTVGPQMGPYPTAESQPWQISKGVNVSSPFGFNQGLGLVGEGGSGSHANRAYSHSFFDPALLQCATDHSLGGSFLQPKKQLGNQIPILPFSNKSNFLDNFVPMNLHNNLGSRSLNQFPQFLNGYSLKDLRGRIVSLAKDQYGSRLLQTEFEDPGEDEIEMVLMEVIDHVGELMKDQFGNYIVQKLVKVCNERQRTLMVLALTKIQNQLISICLNPHGTRVVQRLLETIDSQRQISLVLSALSPGAVVLATDPNGHHVIQQCLIHFSNEDNKYLLNGIADNCLKIATNKHGCCVLQACVDHSQGEYRESLVAEIIAHAIHLAEDPYGNYVVQHLLGLKIWEVTENLVKQFEGSFVSLSCNKYASNVMEKCLTEAGEEVSSQILMEFLRSPDVSMLLIDPFGNFVIQSALSVSKGVIRSALLNVIRANAATLRTNMYGRKVLDRLDKISRIMLSH
ncbi:hypothetical protein RHGRI_021771 [Rhododendron griersonianum]|uniref:PUM-HD domain-containing protein n=1 Tax=Rhododendron griersonianum TaxID=479676 RepID=A0AAV6JPX0_9ERIC|nr:hypothetical protein RHGRI_021771 [Rhododendron griersonianum]